MVRVSNESGVGAGTGGGPPASSLWSDMSSESLLLKLSASPRRAATGALLDNRYYGDSGNPPGVSVAGFASSVTESARSRCTLCQTSCQAASSIENCYLAGGLTVALTNHPATSLVRSFPFLDLFLEGLLLLGSWDSAILAC